MGTTKTADKTPEVDSHSGLSHEAIRAQLDRILTHREFQATDKMRDFLRFVVEEKLSGRANRLKGFTIATRVFDDFDAAQDPIVRIQAGRLRRALERYYLVAGGRDPIFIDIPKGRYIPYFNAPTAASDRSLSGSSMGSGERLDRAIAVCPCHPSWFHTGHVFEHLVRKDYERALAETTKYHPFIAFWNHVMVAAMLGKLGRDAEASEHVERLAEEKPDFSLRARELIGRTLKIEPLVDELLGGLRRAGMTV